jgi:1,4-alpha-glucan branching enzyme
MAGDSSSVRMGANLTAAGATFRVWAPTAKTVSIRGTFNGWSDHFLTRSNDGYWFTTVPEVKEGDQYKFYVVGQGTTGDKRDPFARSLTFHPSFPICNCVVTQPATFPWHDANFQPKPFHELVVYQLHVGAFWSRDAQGRDQRAARPGRFLDLLFRRRGRLGITESTCIPRKWNIACRREILTFSNILTRPTPC